MPFKISGPRSKFRPSSEGGDDAVFARFNAMIGGVGRFVKGNQVEVDGIVDQSAVTVAQVKLLASKGITVEGYGVTVQCTVAGAAAEVPVGVPNRSYIDENDNEIVNTFGDLGGFIFELDAGGGALRRLYVHDHLFDKVHGLTAAHIALIDAVPGCTVLSQGAEFKAIQDANSPEGP